MKIAIKNWKQRLLRVSCAIILICAFSIALSFVLYWFVKVFFNLEFDAFGFSTIISFFGAGYVLLFLARAPLNKGEAKLLRWVDSKLQRYELLTRHVLRQFLVRLGFMVTLASTLVMIPLSPERPLFLIIVLFVGLLLVFLGLLFISEYGMALALLRKFRTDDMKDLGDLDRSLKLYNRAVGFRFSNQKLFTITQYAENIYRLELKKEKILFETKLDDIIKSLDSKKYGGIPKTLAEMSKDVDAFLKNYGKLGIEFKPPLLTRIRGVVGTALQKVFPQFIWLLILILVYLILRMFIPIEISIP